MKLAAALSYMLAALFLASCEANSGTFLLVNKASESIVRAEVSICGQTIKMQDIKPAGSKSGTYEVTSDSHYAIVVEFQSGDKLTKETGYVTSGFDFRDEIIVTGTDIKITKTDLIRTQTQPGS